MPETYIESRLQAELRLLILFIPLIGFSVSEANYLLAFYFVIVYVLVLLLAYISPASKIILFDDHLEYERGSIRWSSPWSGVIGFYESGITPPLWSGGYIIETTMGTTHMIARSMLAEESNPFSFTARPKFEESITRLSGKPLTLKDPGVRKYGNKLDYLFFAAIILFFVYMYWLNSMAR